MTTYRIYYTDASNREDYVCFYGKTFAEAIAQFLTWEQEGNGYKWTLNESAITKIEVY